MAAHAAGRAGAGGSSRAALSRVLHGQDDRLIVVVGPCSIHDHDQAMDYARLLKAQADALAASCWS
jgi:3-deoxy-7-phosphoheptulonate synthase